MKLRRQFPDRPRLRYRGATRGKREARYISQGPGAIIGADKMVSRQTLQHWRARRLGQQRQSIAFRPGIGGITVAGYQDDAGLTWTGRAGAHQIELAVSDRDIPGNQGS